MPTNSPDPSLPDIERRIAALQQRIGDLATEDLPTAVAELQTLIDQARQLKIQIEGSENRIASDGSAIVEGDVGGDVNHSVTFIRNVYQQAPGRPEYDQAQFDAALERYLAWVEKRYGRLNLRGVEKRQQQALTLTLDDVYVSLAAMLTPDRKRRGRRVVDEEQEGHFEEVDMRRLLPLSTRLVITGGPGSGKTTYLHLIAASVARALRANQPDTVRQHLGLSAPLPLPIVVSLSAYNCYRRRYADPDDPRKGTLSAYISHALIQQDSGIVPRDFFERLLTQGQACLLLLDGLDEVANERERILVRQAVENLALNAGVQRLVVTSRTRAYQGQALLPEEFRVAAVQSMSTEQVHALVERWCTAVYDDTDAARETRRLQAAIDGLERLRAARNEPRLADTPLMVTIIAIVHYNQRRLPDQRAELYERCVEVLLTESNKPATEATFELADWGGSLPEKRELLADLAYQMMSAGPDAGRNVDQRALETRLRPRLVRRHGEAQAVAQLAQFVQAMRERGSLLDERGGDYKFTHLTFQEFLAATYLAETVREPGKMVALLAGDGRCADPWWRETILLTAGYLGLKSVDTALAFLHGLTDIDTRDETALAAAELAAVAVLELDNANAATHDRITRRLVALLADVALEARPQTRMLAGDALGRLGDPRPGVCTLEPDLIEIPAGTFLMGDVRLYETEIAEPYAIARYPVTNAQYRLFIEDGGYTDMWRACWTQAGWQWKQEQNRQKPHHWGNAQFGRDNQPVIGVSWYEAVAYVRWLAATTGKPYRLPTEAEWERAARHTDGRSFPWGENRQNGMANTKEVGLERTTAVGVFPKDSTVCGVNDMLGNANEWCQTRYRDEQQNKYGMPYRADDGREELGGGDSVWRVWKGGAWDEPFYSCGSCGRDLPSMGGLLNLIGFRAVLSPLFDFGL